MPGFYKSAIVVTLCATPVFGQEAPDVPTSEDPPTAAELAQKMQRILGRPGGLTATDAARRAVAYDPTTERARARGDAAEAERLQATVAFFPRLTVTGRYMRLSPVQEPSFGPASGNLVATPAPEGEIPPGAPLFAVPPTVLSFQTLLDQWLLQANLTVPISDIGLRIVHERAAASHSVRAAEFETQAAQRTAAANTKIAYYEWIRARMHEIVAEQTLAQAEVRLSYARALEAAGRTSRADAMAAEATVESGALLIVRTKNDARSAQQRLKTLMRDYSAREYEIGETLPTIGGRARPTTLRQYVAEGMRKRPELKALAEQIRGISRRRNAAIGGTAPRLDAFGNVYYANPNQRLIPPQDEWVASWDIGAQIIWSPNDVPGSLAQAGGFDARRSDLVAQRDEVRDLVRNQVREAHYALQTARAAVDATVRSLAAAEEAYRVRVERFRFGQAPMVDVADSEAQLFRVRLERIEAQVGLRIAEIRLAYAVGR